MHWDSVSLTILGPAMLAGLLVLSTHVPLGQQVLNRGIVFIDLAVAQIAALGVIASDLFGWETQGYKVQIAAVSAAMLGALLLTWMEKKWPDVQEAMIGVLFVLAASTGILMLANNPHGGEHLKDLLAGQILWVGPKQLWIGAIVSALILLLWLSLRQRMTGAGFYLLFALAVTLSVQLVGVYLVFSSLIVPALATRNWPSRTRQFGAFLIGALAYALGLLCSALFDLPSGALIVWALVIVGLGVNLIGRMALGHSIFLNVSSKLRET